jgi:integrase
LKPAAIELGLQDIPLCNIKRKHIRLLLEHTGTIKTNWSAHNYNLYRAYLIMLFKVFLQYDAVEINPALSIEKQKTVLKMRETLSEEQRIIIDEYLKSRDPYFRRYIHIFFHSGSRPAELMRLRKEDVDINNQCFKILVQKGKSPKEMKRPIKNIVFHYWLEIMNEALPGQYLFSRGLKPGFLPIRNEQVTRRWKRAIKNKLKIDIDLYSLKHLNLDETAAELNDKEASKMAGRTSTAITKKHYLVNERQRDFERLRNINNPFA